MASDAQPEDGIVGLITFVRNPLVAYDSPAGRLKITRKTFDHLPAWRCEIFDRVRNGRPVGRVFFLCGKCFGRRGNGPATSKAEMWTPGSDHEGKLHYDVVPRNAVCEQCHGRAWPAD